MRTAKSEADYRAALEATIEESDGLIRTFNALLMIARAESGQARDNMTEFDAAEIARGVGELYEPLAEEKGLASRRSRRRSPVPVRGNRELVSQALANLVDNAIKYAGPDGTQEWRQQRGIVVKALSEGDRVLLTVGDQRPGHPRSRPRARGRALRAAGAEPHRAGLGPGPEPCGGGRAAAWRRAEARGQRSPDLRAVIALPRGGPQGAG